MTLNQVGSAGREAIRLILASPFTWLAAILVFLILSEAMMFIPYVVLIMKLLVGCLLVIYLAWSFGFTFALAVRALSLDRRGSGAAG